MNIELEITGIGLWTHGLTNWDEFVVAARNDYADVDDVWIKPAPAIIPGRERRRAPLIVKLAVEVMEQASRMAAIDPGAVATVFTSAVGDTEITEYICSTLAGEQKMLSPTKFHNSVNNAPSGYWSISMQNRAPSTFVSGIENSFAVGLLEAATLCATENTAVALAAYDIASSQPLTDVFPISQPFGCALVLEPAGARAGWTVAIGHGTGSATLTETAPAFVRKQVEGNPAARCLPLLDALARQRAEEIRWSTGPATCIGVQLIADRNAPTGNSR
jgi:hypothetical protein